MLPYVLRRLGYAVLTLWVIVTLTFVLMHSIPGNPFQVNENRRISDTVLANLQHKYGLDRPFYEQYGIYLGNIFLRGDFGTSMMFQNREVNEIIKAGFPYSAKVGLLSLLFCIPAGLGLGILAALKRGRFWDYGTVFVALLGFSVPSFIVASLLQYLLGVKWHLLPVAGWGDWRFLIMPSFCLGLTSMAGLARFMRSSMLTTLSEDYLRTARAKGLSAVEVTWRHALRNSLIPIITILGLQVVGVITGTFFIEQVFNIPGIGRYFINSMVNLDYTMILGLTIFWAAMVLLGLFSVDILYVLVDPRIRIGKEAR